MATTKESVTDFLDKGTGNLSIKVPPAEKPRIVIIGGGFAGIELVKTLPRSNYQVVLLDKHNYHTFQPLLYQVATAGLEPDSIAGPLRRLIKNKEDFFFRMGEVVGIEPGSNTIKTTIGDLQYDYLVIAAGSSTNFFGKDDFEENAFSLKEVPNALDLRSQILQNFEKAVMSNDDAEQESLMNFVVVGGGPTGVELSGALGELKQHVLPKDYPDLNFQKMKIHLVEGLERLLPMMSETAGKKAYKYLQNFEVNIHLEKMVESYDGKEAILSDGTVLKSQTLIWAAGVKGNVIEGIPENSQNKGRIIVDRFNKIDGYENIFAIGDVAFMKTEKFEEGLPMLAPVAIQQGKHLSKNFKRLADERSMIPFEYTDKGTMATIGRNRAVVDLGPGYSFGGLFAWIIWMFVHLVSIIGFRNKLIVFSNWVWNYFTYDRSTRLIIRPFVPSHQRKNPAET